MAECCVRKDAPSLVAIQTKDDPAGTPVRTTVTTRIWPPLFLGNIMASSLGIVTHFCSCSAIPLFIGFMESGIPLGVTFSFLIAAPMINEVALVLLFGLFGWKTALLYASTGLAIAIGAGWIIGRLKVERFVEPWVYEIKAAELTMEEQKTPFFERIQAGYAAVADIVSKVWIYIAIGIAVGAGVHGYVPENFMASLMGKSAWWSVPLAALFGVPLYSNAVDIEKVGDIEKVVKYGVFCTPAVVVDGRVKSVGKIPGEKELLAWLGK